MTSINEIRVCMDIGGHAHRVGIGLSDGELLEEFDIQHTTSGISELFTKISRYEEKYQLPVSVAMEAYNGHARPIDQEVLARGYQLWNVNNNKLAQFKKVFPGPAKTDKIDTRKMFELFKMRDHLPLAKSALQEIILSPDVNLKLKRLSRRRRCLVDDKIAIINRLQDDLQACIPGLLEITGSVDNKWFLNFITCRDDMKKLARIQKSGLQKIKGVGSKYIEIITAWQKTASFSVDIAWVGEMIVSDGKRVLALMDEISQLERQIKLLIPSSEIASRIGTIPGFGDTSSAELAGEIGTLSRFTSEGSLALYLGMAVLDNSSGTNEGSKSSKHVNKRCKKAMMIAVARHINYCPESKKYYEMKRASGKKHNQAVRALGRHLVRVIWSMLKNRRDYVYRDGDALKK